MAKDKKSKDVLAPRASKVTKPAQRAKKSNVNLSDKVFKSAERITESDDEDMVDAPAPISIPPPVTNGKLQDLSDSGGSEDDVDDETDDDDGGDGNDRDADEPDSEVDGKDGEPAHPTSTTVHNPTKSTTSSTVPPNSGRIDNDLEDGQLRPTVEFKAPMGFKDTKNETISAHTDIFRPKNSKGKEIWYISAPASLPITALKEVALQKFAAQQAIMSHNDEDYTLVSDPAVRDSTRVLLPENKRGYKVIPTPVKHVLQFQQILRVQATSSIGRPKTTSQVLLDTDLPTKQAKKSQPTGLKMRFRPAGFGNDYLGAIGSSDEEDLPSLSSFKHPPHAVTSIRNEPEDAMSQNKSEKTKKKKDKRVSIATPEEITQKNEAYVTEATTAIDANQDTAPSEAVSKEGKKKKKKDRKGVEAATGIEPSDEPMNGETIPVDEAVPLSEEAHKSKKEKKKKRKETEADARAVNGLAEGEGGAVSAPTPTEDEIAEKKRRKKEKKEKKARLAAGEA